MTAGAPTPLASRRWPMWLVALGALTYCVAWFLPAWTIATDDGVRRIDGWMAFRMAWEITLSGETAPHWSQRLMYATCLTNVVMVAALLLSFAVRTRLALGIALLVCAAVDAAWLRGLFTDPAPIGPGCVAWIASFALVGVGLVASRARR